jgi:hypothetical protein
LVLELGVIIPFFPYP